MEEIPAVLVLATMDTKADQVAYVQACLREANVDVLLMDVGIMGKSPFPVAVSQDDVAFAAGYALADVQNIGHEGKAAEIMIAGATRRAEELYLEGRIDAVMGLGGSVGTSIATAVMRSFPIGFPKVMISTLASHDVRPFVGTKDILMLPTICDLSGINRITKKILKNGALAAAGMARQGFQEVGSLKPLAFITTLGTTDPCALRVKEALEAKGMEVIIFHTTGTGGRAMEEMVRLGEAEIVVEISLQELVSNLFGGEYDAGPDRASAALQRGIPTLLVPGCTDLIVGGPLLMTQKHFPNRQYHAHNDAIATVRTDHRETEILACALAKLCNEARGPRAIAVPLGGLSGFDRPGGPLYDPEAPKIMAETLKKELDAQTALYVSPHHINDPEFGALLAGIVKAWLQ
jgi:uncharacterized protein (UPF0261 family)